MKLVRYGDVGAECRGLIDKAGLRDPSKHVSGDSAEFQLRLGAGGAASFTTVRGFVVMFPCEHISPCEAGTKFKLQWSVQ
jgi:hypothetical protein